MSTFSALTLPPARWRWERSLLTSPVLTQTRSVIATSVSNDAIGYAQLRRWFGNSVCARHTAMAEKLGNGFHTDPISDKTCCPVCYRDASEHVPADPFEREGERLRLVDTHLRAQSIREMHHS